LGGEEAIKTITRQMDRVGKQFDWQRPTTSATVALVLPVVMSLESTPMTMEPGVEQAVCAKDSNIE